MVVMKLTSKSSGLGCTGPTRQQLNTIGKRLSNISSITIGNTGDLVLGRVNVPDPNHCKIPDKWEQSPYRVIEKLNNQLVFRVPRNW